MNRFPGDEGDDHRYTRSAAKTGSGWVRRKTESSLRKEERGEAKEGYTRRRRQAEER
jgi:hypothetical protein